MRVFLLVCAIACFVEALPSTQAVETQAETQVETQVETQDETQAETQIETLPIDAFVGIEYDLDPSKTENLEKLLRARGVPEVKIYFARFVAQTIVLLKKNEDGYRLKSTYSLDVKANLPWWFCYQCFDSLLRALLTTNYKPFILDMPFPYYTEDGHDTTCTFTADGNKLIQTLEEEGEKDMVITKEFTEDTMKSTTNFGDIETVRYFNKRKGDKTIFWD